MHDIPPWPFPSPPEPGSEPTWICPSGTCACHPSSEEEAELVPHRIVFHDSHGARMPLARCMVYERGRPLTSPTTAADATGELELELRLGTSRLMVAWCPPEELYARAAPYQKLYHVDLGSEPTRRRLANVGFASRSTYRDNIRDYQRAHGQPETGREEDISEDLRRRHDEGALAPFVARPDVESVVASTGEHAFARAFHDPATLGRAPMALRSHGLRSHGFAAEAKAKQGSGDEVGGPGGGRNRQGAVVPNVGHLWLLVGLEPEGPLHADDVTIRLLSVQADRSVKPTLIAPTLVGVDWDAIPDRYVLCVFADVPEGAHFVLGHGDDVKDAPRRYALGQTAVTVTTGLLTLGYLPLDRDRAILTPTDPLLELDVDVMQRRRKVLAMLHSFFPQSAGAATAPSDMPPYQQGSYKQMLPGLDATNTCAPINVLAMRQAGAVGERFGFNQV